MRRADGRWLLPIMIGLFVCLLAFGPTMALGQQFLGKSVADWTRQLDSAKNASQRRSAAFALGKLGSQAVTAASRLKKCLADPKEEPSVREAAAFALGEIGREGLLLAADGDVVKILSDVLASDADALVRRSAAFALGALGKEALTARPVLEAALAENNHPAVRQNAAWALGRLGPDTVPALSKAVLDKDWLVRRDAAYALGSLGPEAAKPALPELLVCCQTPDSEVRRAALTVLIRLVGPGDVKAAPALRQALTDGDAEVRRNAALALSNIGGPEAAVALGTLRDALRQLDQVELRRQAAAAMRNLGAGAKTAVPELVACLNDADEEVRSLAAFALGGIGEAASRAVPALAKMVANSAEKPAVRVKAAVAMKNIGSCPAAVDAVPALLKVLQDPTQDKEVRERILWALRVHEGNLQTLPGVYPALTKVMSEPRNPQANLLRYDCAYLLGVLQGSATPEKTLDVLLEFLQDDNYRFFASEDSKVQGANVETGSGKTKIVTVGKGDFRVVAVKTLQRIGVARVRQRADIVQQLQALARNDSVDADLRQKTQEFLRELGK